ncbi:TPA: hypothetical protein HA335_06085 [Methanocaldococcus jannaschii]|uniref:Uncharacterized protein MJ0271 n=2 Tax=Methanocaldococcus jannaschii TaxID=2190 RepID=Y271_METJA|nr:hypothetical protein [Methanocaldococcus jannaschii]Q57719.1 RecName: Full=Uncharacterized protein MJ0271 [Methanocaldococcus jannaschii DSM 2661]AAB98260.1 hypothetical protein MJ_0271 [Methanocaldococcus jannaschii DSM 2661]HII60116.1 hypothetical protein [Methanocaldococcus jannaschii]
MDLKSNIKLILATDLLAVLILSLFIKNFKMVLAFLLAVFVIWLFIDKNNINERLYENLLAMSVGFIEGILIFLGIIYNEVFLDITLGIFAILILIVMGILFPKYKLIFEVFDEFVEHLKQKSGFLTLISIFGMLLTIYVFLLILPSKEFCINAVDIIRTIMLVITANMFIIEFYTFKKFS